MKLALVLHPSRSVAAELAADVAQAATAMGFEVSVDETDAARVPDAPLRNGGHLDADVVVAVGGDGTVLEAARRAARPGLPVLGVNAGHVGFLAEVQPEAITPALKALLSGDFGINERMTLHATTSTGRSLDALNDVVLDKAVSQHIIRIAIAANGEDLVEYRADGVIVATPTGSTAYTFSAGGPLVDPELSALCVTAVAPHNLFDRPIVFGPTTTLNLTVRGERSARIHSDGRDNGMIDPGDSVEIGVGDTVVRLIRLHPQHFAASVKQKFRLHDA